MRKIFLMHSTLIVSLLLASCAMAATPTVAPTLTPMPAAHVMPPITEVAVTPLPTPTSIAAVTPTRGPTPTPLPEARIFVACETAKVVDVYQGFPARKVGEVKVGEYPHNISASNNGKYVATALRNDGTISVIDVAAIKEIARIPVGTTPHDLAWAPDDSLLYVTHEFQSYFSIIDTKTWKLLKHVDVKFAQHDVAISFDGSELWFTMNHYRGILVLDRQTLKVKKEITGFANGAHDLTLIPERDEVFVTSSGFIEKSSDANPFVLVFDTKTYKLKDSKPMGFYPFHSVKKFRDGFFLEPNLPTFWLSDRGLGGVLEIDIAERKVITQLKTGKSPFHMSAGPGGLIYVANHDDSTVSVVDTNKRVVVETIKVAKDPHVVVVVPAP